MNPKQCKLARILLGWSAKELSQRSRVGLNAIRGFEGEKRSIRALTSRKLRATFVTNGIEFFDDKDGMGLRKKPNIDEYIRNEELYASHFKPFYRSVKINEGLLESYI